MMEVLWSLVKEIPAGRCATYGELGRALPNPVSGKIIGGWMAQAPEGVPWWRVIAKAGGFPIAKRDPSLGLTQRQLLEQEGVPFVGDVVDLTKCEWTC